MFLHSTRLLYPTRYPPEQFGAPLAATKHSSRADESSAIDEIRRKELRILLIDDDDDFRKSFCFKLKRKYKVKVEDVNSGKAGIDKLRLRKEYDLIFTDIMMPEMTGIDTYHELRKIDANIPIVIMSAYSDSDEWKRAQDLKDISLLHKPIPDEALIKILIQHSGE